MNRTRKAYLVFMFLISALVSSLLGGCTCVNERRTQQLETTVVDLQQRLEQRASLEAQLARLSDLCAQIQRIEFGLDGFEHRVEALEALLRAVGNELLHVAELLRGEQGPAPTTQASGTALTGSARKQ